MIFCFGALAAMLVGFSQCTPKVLVSIQTFSDIFPSGFYSCNLQMPTTPSCFLFQLAFVFFVRLVKWNPGKTHIYFREVPTKCPSILADVSAEMLSLWFQEAVGEHCLLSHYGLWCGDIDRQGLGGDETRFFTACDLTQASHPAQCSHLECLDSLRYMLLAVLMVLSLVSQWWTLLRLRLGSCQQMLSFHSKNRGF